jgi:serine/threonine protein kinase
MDDDALDAAGLNPLRLLADTAPLHKYDLLEQIGKGGYGVVHKARDPVLGCSVAIKVFHRTLTDERALARFLEEPQVTSQLDHPGVVPIHALGKMPDGRPAVVMKLVAGKTLQRLLSESRAPADHSRFLEIFKQVCQTVAYAHKKRGVLHRDLKPGNIMVGAFGEVYVMDWGLSKVMLAPPEAPGEAGPAPVETLRTGNAELATQAGLALGTRAYMSPEQARGEIENITARSDVFGLGAILCEILTGSPPYWVDRFAISTIAGNDVKLAQEEVLAAQVQRIERGDVAQAHVRLDASGADAQLIALAKACLAPRPEDRPADAGVVADAITAYLDGLQVKIKQQEVDKATLEARLQVEQSHVAALRWRALAGVVVMAALGLGTWYKFTQAAQEAAAVARQQAREADARSSLERVATALKAELPQDARLALGHAEDRLAEGGPESLLEQVRSAHRDLAFVDAWEKVRQKRSSLVDGQFDDDGVSLEYSRIFLNYGLDVNDPQTASAKIRESPIQAQLLAALDHWALVSIPSARFTILQVAHAASASPWGQRFRDPLLRQRPDFLAELARELAPQEHTPVEIESLAWALARAGDPEPMLRRGLTRYPGDFWLNLQLALALEAKARGINQDERRRDVSEEEVGYLRVCLALRPQSGYLHEVLGRALVESQRLDEAESELKRAMQIQDTMSARLSLVRVLMLKEAWDEAENACREALHLSRPAPAQQTEPLNKLLREIHAHQSKK